MKFGVLGTGPMGQGFAARLSELGHGVMMGTRRPEATLARTDRGTFGTPPLSEWRDAHPQVELGTFAQAAAYGEIVVNATLGSATLEVLASVGEKALAGKVLLDVSNPLDYSAGMPLSLTVCNTDSLGEQIQRALPRTRVVKALNTMYAALALAPELLAGGDHTVFVSGDEATAKQAVVELLRTLGWRDIFDLGDLSAGRGAEMMLPLWVRIFAAMQSPIFAFKLVRAAGLAGAAGVAPAAGEASR